MLANAVAIDGRRSEPVAQFFDMMVGIEDIDLHPRDDFRVNCRIGSFVRS